MSDQPDQNSNTSDLIYRAPEAATAVAPEGDLMSAYLGPKNADYYSSIFSRFESTGGGISWNWPAFFISSVWLLYRKMWLNALVYWVGLPILFGAVGLLLDFTIGAGLGILAANLVYLVVIFVLMPMFANALYYRHAKAKLQKVSASATSEEEQRLQAARVGGTSSVVLIVIPVIFIFFIGILAAIAIPAYQDYTVRAQVAEGLNLSAGVKAAVMEEYERSGSLPVDNAAAGIAEPTSISGQYVESVAVANGEIVVTYGNQAEATLSGKTLGFYLEQAEDNSLSWRCYSDDIAEQQLPSACR